MLVCVGAVVHAQEVDIGVPRTRGVDAPGEIAARLGMEYVFATEVEHPCVRPSFGCHTRGGRQGNAIVSRYPLSDAVAVRLRCQRHGRARESHEAYKWHVAVGAVAHTPFGDVECYCAHLDAHKNGPEGRAAQYGQLMDAVRQRHVAGRAVVVAGDFNTITSGLAQCVRPEAVWFDRHAVAEENRKTALGSGDTPGVGGSAARTAPAGVPGAPSSKAPRQGSEPNLGVGASADASGQSCAKELTLHDPFDKRADVTMVALGGLLRVKLDWLLLSSTLRVRDQRVGNHRQDVCSDHFWVAVDVEPWREGGRDGATR